MAYDAKGQLSLATFDNELMTRYAYDPLTFRLKRVRTERYDYTLTGNTHEYDYLSGNVRQDTHTALRLFSAYVQFILVGCAYFSALAETVWEVIL